jgi:hypothetical protein
MDKNLKIIHGKPEPFVNPKIFLILSIHPVLPEYQRCGGDASAGGKYDRMGQ